MLIFHDPKLVVFSVPRTGSTSLHRALNPYADIELRDPPKRKHMTARFFERWAKEEAPEILSYTRAVVLREPFERVASFYRYRRRDAVARSENSTKNMSFEEFMRHLTSENPPPPAAIGNQFRFSQNSDGALGIHEFFCIEKPDVMTAYFSGIFGPIELPKLNGADDADMALPQELFDRFKEQRSAEYELYAQVAKTGRFTPGAEEATSDK